MNKKVRPQMFVDLEIIVKDKNPMPDANGNLQAVPGLPYLIGELFMEIYAWGMNNYKHYKEIQKAVMQKIPNPVIPVKRAVEEINVVFKEINKRRKNIEMFEGGRQFAKDIREVPIGRNPYVKIDDSDFGKMLARVGKIDDIAFRLDKIKNNIGGAVANSSFSRAGDEICSNLGKISKTAKEFCDIIQTSIIGIKNAGDENLTEQTEEQKNKGK